jgi:hypothetical protein
MQPSTAAISFARALHLPASPHTTILHGMPETEQRTLGIQFLDQTHPLLWIGKCTVSPLPSSDLPAGATFLHHPAPPFYMTRPQLRDSRSVLVQTALAYAIERAPQPPQPLQPRHLTNPHYCPQPPFHLRAPNHRSHVFFLFFFCFFFLKLVSFQLQFFGH